MGRSLFFSSLAHLAFMSCLLVVFSSQTSIPPPRERERIISRPLRVAPRPKLPQMTAGLALAEASPSSAEEPPPALPEAVHPIANPDPAPAPAKTVTKTSPPKRQSPSPQLLLPEPSYPTRPSNERSMMSETAAGSGPVRALGEDSGEDRPALPYHHPAVTLTGMSDRSFILVRFEIEANGQFEVEILEGTGNIHHDARVLYVLKRWKWLPMRIEGENLASVEVVRLFRKETSGSEEP